MVLSQKIKYFSAVNSIRKGNTIKMAKRSVVARSCWGGRRGEGKGQIGGVQGIFRAVKIFCMIL